MKKEKIINWCKKQSYESLTAYFLGFCGFIIAIDALFFQPWVITRYGNTNEGMNIALMIFMFCMILINNHKIKTLQR